MSATIQKTIHSTIRKAKDQYPQAFKMMTPDEELIFEAVEEHHSTVLDIQMYTRMEKVRVTRLLEGLVARGIVREHRERRQSITKGPELRTYTIIRK
jgi:DNA-binding MarR family transcriptional regulator